MFCHRIYRMLSSIDSMAMMKAMAKETPNATGFLINRLDSPLLGDALVVECMPNPWWGCGKGNNLRAF